LRLLDGGKITAGASPKSARQEQPMQVTQNIPRNTRSAQGHRGANAGVEHPRWKGRYDTRLDLDMDDASPCALLAVVNF
jgi:hypothetical protein